jgi:hypothetical protein
LAATARNVYFAPALPGIALLVSWWARETLSGPDRWEVRAMRATAALLLLGVVTFVAALVLIGLDAWHTMDGHTLYILISSVGLFVATALAIRAWGWARDQAARAQCSLFLAFCALLIGPASQVYRQVNVWQDLAKISRAIESDAAGRRLVLLAPDETTRAMIDMYARTSVDRIAGPLDAGAADRIGSLATAAPDSVFVVQLPTQRAHAIGQLLRRTISPADPLPPWIQTARLRVAKSYALPNGRRYALLEIKP